MNKGKVEADKYKKSFRNFLESRYKNPNTINKYFSHFSVMFKYFNFKNMDFSVIDSKQLETFITYKKYNSDETISKIYRVFNLIMEFENIDRRLKAPKIKRKISIDTPLTEHEIKRAVDLATPRTRAMILTIGTTGLRPNELKQIKIKHLYENKINVISKGGIEREIVLPRSTKIHLRRYCRTKGYIGDGEFVFSSSNKNTGQINVTKALRYLNDKMGFPKGTLTSKTLRQFFIRTCIKRGLHPFEIASLMGHSDINTTLRYFNRMQFADEIERTDNERLFQNLKE